MAPLPLIEGPSSGGPVWGPHGGYLGAPKEIFAGARRFAYLAVLSLAFGCLVSPFSASLHARAPLGTGGPLCPASSALKPLVASCPKGPPPAFLLGCRAPHLRCLDPRPGARGAPRGPRAAFSVPEGAPTNFSMEFGADSRSEGLKRLFPELQNIPEVNPKP